MTSYTRPRPPADPLNQPHWDAARRGVLLLYRCTDCGTHQFPAARWCQTCQGAHGLWVESSGHGTIESFCTFHKAYWPGFSDAIPYDVVQVHLDEGVRLFSNICELDGKPLTIGMRVMACFDAVASDLTLIKFKPIDQPPGGRAKM